MTYFDIDFNSLFSGQSAPGSGGAIGAMVRHGHSLLSKQYNALLVMDREPGDEENEKEKDRKKGGAELERQARAITKVGL